MSFSLTFNGGHCLLLNEMALAYYSLPFRHYPRSRYGQMPQVHVALVPALHRHGFMVAGQIHGPR